VRQAVARRAPLLVDTDDPSVQIYVCRQAQSHLLYLINEDHAQARPFRLKFARPLLTADLRLRLSPGVQRKLVGTLLPGEGRVLRLTQP
jgi:hypothetical protein